MISSPPHPLSNLERGEKEKQRKTTKPQRLKVKQNPKFFIIVTPPFMAGVKGTHRRALALKFSRH
jgi:RNase H-fold protein (predicted Holliday junction resolvase)